MGVDINVYRAAIGTFSNASRNISVTSFNQFQRRKHEQLEKLMTHAVIGWLKILFLLCVGLSVEFNEQKFRDIYENKTPVKPLLSTVPYQPCWKTYDKISLNIAQTFYIGDHDGETFYSFTNLSNKYAKRTYGNRKKNGIILCHFNKGNSLLYNRVLEVENIINQYRPHVLGISELNFFKEHNPEDVQIRNYQFITSKTLDNPELNISRVGVYLHNSMVGTVRQDLMDDTFSSIWIEAGLPNKRKILICNLYREWGYMRQDNPSLSRDLSEQLKRWKVFLTQWERALTEDKEVIVTGDMNINHLDWTDDNTASNQTKKLRPLITELFTRIFPHGISQLVSSATYNAPHQPASGLDHFYTNDPRKLSSVQVITNGMSDHKLLLATRYSTSIKRKVRYVTKRCFKNFKNEDFIKAVRSINLWEIYQCSDADTALELLSNSLTQILDMMAPIRTIQIRENYAPWLSSETKIKMAERDNAKKIASETNCEEHWILYRRLRNTVNRVLRKEKHNWQKDKLKKFEEDSDCKQIWRSVKSCLNWTTSGTPSQLFYEGKLETQPSQLAECMNKYFIQKVQNLKENLAQTNHDPLSKLRRLMYDRKCKFNLKPVHPDLIDKMIRKLKNSGSVGLDYIDTKIIKLARAELVPAITHIINLSINTSTFPAQFKKAKVVPLHKSGDELNAKNYRPVAMLPVLSKLAERAIFVQVLEYFEHHGLLHPNHHGFRPHHSTTSALLQMYDTWIEAMDRGEATGVIFLDLSAAFDMVPHSLLIEKLKLYGFDEDSSAWIYSYLSGRMQTVCIDGTCSSLLPLEYGVPQGSILGPLLYVIFTNDLPEVVHDHHDLIHGVPHDNEHLAIQQHSYSMLCPDCGGICCYADDSSYSYSSKSAYQISETITAQFRKISDCMARNKLKLNGDKTHLLCLMTDEARRAKPTFQIELNTGEEVIEASKSEKLLGGIIGQNLKFAEHIQNDEKSLLKTVSKRLAALKKLSYLTSFKSRKMIANGLIMSKLVYLITLWAGTEKYLIKSLQIIQNKAARIVTRQGRRTPVQSILGQCGWLSIAQLGVFHSLVEIFKIMVTKSPHYLYLKLTPGSVRELRSTADLKIRLGGESQAVSELARNSFKYRATRQWNMLPLEIRQAENLNIFKLKLKKWVAENIAIS